MKTGTSQAYHDNWTIGYTRDVTVGVWVGNFDRTPLRSSTGVTGAAPIFHAVMQAATRRLHGSSDAEILPAPEGMSEHEVCALSGMPANDWCPSRQRERMPSSGEPPCSWHHLSDGELILIWPPQYRQWARQQGLMTEARTAVVPASSPKPSAPARPSAPIEIVSPPAGGVYLIDPTLRREFQTLALRVVTAQPVTIEWAVGGRVIGTSSSETPVQWPLTPGSHRITARRTRARRGVVGGREVVQPPAESFVSRPASRFIPYACLAQATLVPVPRSDMPIRLPGPPRARSSWRPDTCHASGSCSAGRPPARRRARRSGTRPPR